MVTVFTAICLQFRKHWTAAGLLCLPVPEKNYLIDGTIFIHSNQELRLDRYTVIRLAEDSNCSMPEDSGDREWNENITVSGGVWNMNGPNQAPNPYHFSTIEGNTEKLKGYDKNSDYKAKAYLGFCFRLFKVKGLNFCNLTIANPVTYGLQIAYVETLPLKTLFSIISTEHPNYGIWTAFMLRGTAKTDLSVTLKAIVMMTWWR